MIALLLVPLLLAGPLDKAAQKRQAAAQAQVYAAVDQTMVSTIASYRAQAEAHAGDARYTLAWVGALHAAIESGTLSRGALTYDTDVAPAIAAISPAAKASPQTAPDLYASGSAVLAGAGKPDEAAAMAELSLKLRPSATALATLLSWQETKDPAKIPETCKGVLAGARDDLQRFLVLDTCMKRSGTADPAVGLAWASAADRAFYAKELDAMAAGDAARAAEREAHGAQMAAEARARSDEQARASSTSGASTSGAPSASSGPTSVSAYIACKENVRVFRGSSTGSGTYGWESPNSRVSYSLSAGQELCVCNDRDQRQSCWTAPGGGRVDVEIGCGGISAR